VVNEYLTFGTLLRVPNVDPNHRHVRARRGLHNARYRGQCNALKERRGGKSFCYLGRSNRKRRVRVPVGNTKDLQKGLGLRQARLYLSILTKTSNFLQPLLNCLQLFCRGNKIGRYEHIIPCLVH